MKYFLYRLKWYLSKWFDFDCPVHIDLELTNRCNLNCKQCFRQDIKMNEKDINFWQARTIIMALRKWGVDSIKFNWRGEALLNSDFAKIIEQCKGLYTMLNTRLSVKLDDYTKKALLKINNLKISLDSAKRIPSYVIQNLIWLTNNKKNVIIQRRFFENTENLNEFKKILMSKKIPIKNIKILQAPAIERNNKNVGIKLTGKRRYCAQPSRRLIISNDLNVYTCCVGYGKDKELCLGSLAIGKDSYSINEIYKTKRDLEKIWNSKKRLNLVNSLKKNPYGLKKTCVNCVSRDAYK